MQRAKTPSSTAAAAEPRPSVVLMNGIYSSDVSIPERSESELRKGISQGKTQKGFSLAQIRLPWYHITLAVSILRGSVIQGEASRQDAV